MPYGQAKKLIKLKQDRLFKRLQEIEDGQKDRQNLFDYDQISDLL